jgi:nicotinate-nucleotide--dimethylbenzimidazole phosphoribosyltransferase
MNTRLSPALPGGFEDTIRRIVAPNAALAATARAHLDSLTKPLGSLGRLEDLATQLVALRDGDASTPFRKAVYVFAADHGIVAEGVSAYPPGVTRQMVLNFLAGGAAINVLSRLHRVAVHIVDVGVDGDFEPQSNLCQRKVRRGSRNMLHEPAMSHEELSLALDVGLQLADEAAARGETIVAVGEMGIGNTSAASALTSVLTGQPVELVTGRGAGLDDVARARKCRVLSAVLDRYQFRQPLDAAELLRCIGGIEIAAMTGMILGAAGHRIAVVADGFISTAAAALAITFAPSVRSYLFAGHQSQEPGHRILLEHFGLDPVLRLDMRLGEGTGAVLALPILESALCLYSEMATFASARVDTATAKAAS